MSVAVPKPKASSDGLFGSYAQLTEQMCEQVTGVCLLNANLSVRGARGKLEPDSFRGWVSSLEWEQPVKRAPRAKSVANDEWLTAVPIQHTDGQLLGVLGVLQRSWNGSSARNGASDRYHGLLQRVRGCELRSAPRVSGASPGSPDGEPGGLTV